MRPPLPPQESAAARNPIDVLLAEQRRKQELTAQPEAPRLVLLRRLYLDLIGIPPSAGEIAACETDASPDWYGRTAQRLLDDPRHGERWARHWMDVWRYSDWWGLDDQLRNSQKHIWHWRDWIVESLNADTPYDEMLRLMLAADELHPNDLDKLRATGYLARNFFLFNRNQWMEETVEHVSKGFLGLTMNCARCHDHKFDPVPQADYYRLRAFFEPYQVRVDVVPGEADLTRDGIPRAFDGAADVPTYLYVRGDEKNPDTSKLIAPGVPALLAFADLDIQPVSLPPEAWQPERRPWVLDAHLAAGQRRLAIADAEFQQAEAKLAVAKQGDAQIATATATATGDVPQPPIEADSLFFADQFATLDADRWKSFGGLWAHEPGRLVQNQDGAAWSALRLLNQPPRDFDATVRFTILGGSQYRSVGLSFDANERDPANPTAATDSEQNVYVSALAGGSKIQAAFRQGGSWQYPDGAARRSVPIELNRAYTLRVQVRGSLVNASLDGQPLIAWETTLPRRDGALQLVTFDAIAVFHDVTIRVLDPAVPLARSALADVQDEWNVAAAALALARAELESVARRGTAEQALWSAADRASPPEQTLQHEPSLAAVRAERRATAAKTRHDQAVAQQALHRAASDKREAAEKTLQEASTALEKATAAAEGEIKPTDSFTPLAGASWSATRFHSSTSDDPKVEFSPHSTGRRTALAHWITDRRNPLTARVAVNRLWHYHFGTGIVATPS
ncbi:MAG TPA: DUF1549 domain-containing protein, partial [Pirellulales bacterium]|nr:DUF1549 domain-containing protein [Pirellulales bacterium]